MNPNYTFYLWTDIGENRLGLSCAKLRSSSEKCVHPTALNLCSQQELEFLPDQIGGG